MRSLLPLLIGAVLWGQAPQVPLAPPRPPELQPVWERYENLIEAYPEEPLLHYNFGNLAYGAGDFSKALEEYQAALAAEDRTSQARIFYNLGNSFFRAGQRQAAAAFYRRSLQLNPADQDARVNYELATRMAAEEEQESRDSPASDPDADKEQQEGSEEGRQRDSEGGQDQANEDQQQQQNDRDPASAGEEGDAQQSHNQTDPQQAAADSLQREEAEAILNALRANDENLLQRRYRSPKAVKLEKDW